MMDINVAFLGTLLTIFLVHCFSSVSFMFGMMRKVFKEGKDKKFKLPKWYFIMMIFMFHGFCLAVIGFSFQAGSEVFPFAAIFYLFLIFYYFLGYFLCKPSNIKKFKITFAADAKTILKKKGKKKFEKTVETVMLKLFFKDYTSKDAVVYSSLYISSMYWMAWVTYIVLAFSGVALVFFTLLLLFYLLR